MGKWNKTFKVYIKEAKLQDYQSNSWFAIRVSTTTTTLMADHMFKIPDISVFLHSCQFRIKW